MRKQLGVLALASVVLWTACKQERVDYDLFGHSADVERYPVVFEPNRDSDGDPLSVGWYVQRLEVQIPGTHFGGPSARVEKFYPAGAYKLLARSKGHQTVVLKFAVRPDSGETIVPVHFREVPPRTVRILDQAGAPMAHRFIWFTEVDGFQLRGATVNMTTDENGVAELPPLPSGLYPVEFAVERHHRDDPWSGLAGDGQGEIDLLDSGDEIVMLGWTDG